MGEPFEFQSPSQSEIEERFYTQETLAFTDDTKLFLSSLHAYRMSPKNTDYFWPLMKKTHYQLFGSVV